MDGENILDGCVQVAVTHIDHETCIWVNVLPCPKLKFEYSDLEDDNAFSLKKYKEKKRHKGVVPEVGKRYAVFINDNSWFRGEVVSTNGNESKVFLIDIGKQDFVSNTSILPLPNKLKAVPALAFQISFYGIKPLCMQFNEMLMFSKTECQKWQPYHVHHMKDIIDKSEKIYFKEINKLKGVSYGIILAQKSNGEITNLNQYFCDEGWAKKCKTCDGFDHSSQTETFGNLGSLSRMNREFLLKAAFGDKVSKNVTSQKNNVENIDLNILEEPSKSNNNPGKKSGSPEANGDDSLKNLEENQTVSENINKNNFTDYSDALEGKPMDAHVLKLYERFEKLRNISATSESSTYESEDEIKEKIKKRNSNKFYSGALLHQSPTIEEEIEPSERLIDSNINENIHQILEARQRKDLTQIQMYVYPILTKHYNLVMVSNPHSGKTLSSVVAVLSLLNDTEYYECFSKGYGPKAIFISSFSQNVRAIEKMCQILLRNQKNIVVKSAHGGDAVEKKKCELVKGCDVLITTPRCLVRLLKARLVVNMERLCHLIFDDGDFIFNNFLPEIQEIMKLVTFLENKRKNDHICKRVQKIVLSEKWFPVLESFVKEIIKDGFICIPMNNLLEAAVYSRVRPNIQFLKPENKCNALTDLIKGERGTVRTVILAKNKEESLELQQKLDRICGRLLVAHEGMDHVAVASIKNAWLEDVDGIHAVMICTDDVLFELAISNADRLIHYSLPDTKTQFSCRFVCLLEKYRNVFNQETSSSCKVNIFVDEESDEQFPEIVSLMKRLRFPIEEQIQNVVMRINLRKEMNKKEKMLCENFKQFGDCWKIGRCHYRHIVIPEVDNETEFPKAGYVKVKIVGVHDASHFSVVILEHKVKKEWNKLPGLDHLALINLKMENYFENEDNRFLHIKPKINDIIAVETTNGFQRACIIDLLKFDDKKKPTDVKVKLLETGEVADYKSYNLYQLPGDLKKEPPQAVDVYLCKLQPTDFDKYWSDAAYKLVMNWWLKAETAIDKYGDNHFLCGRIVLNIGRNLWLDPFTYSEWLESTEAEVYRCSFRHELIRQNLAVEKSNHLDLLYKQCKLAGLDIPSPATLPTRIEGLNLKGQWAHINKNEFNDVCLVFAKSPEQLFLRIPKFEDRLDALQKDINQLEKMQLLKKGYLNVGDLCLAFYPENKTWNRAKVLSFPSEDKVEVFYADHGNFDVLNWDQLAKIPANLVKKLPLQAIECRLAGVQPIHERGWSDSSVSLLYNLSEIEEGLWKILSAYVFDLELKAEVTDGRKYIVALLEVDQDHVMLLNKELVINAEANWFMEEKQLLDDICDKYIKFKHNENMNDEFIGNEDWEKCEVNNNNSKDSSNNHNEVVEVDKINNFEAQPLNAPSSIVDEQLQKLYEAIEDDTNFEIGDASALLGDLLNLSMKNSICKPKPDLLKLPTSSSPESKPDLAPKIKPALFSLPKHKPALLPGPKTKNSTSSDNADADRSDFGDNNSKDSPPFLKQIGNCHTPLVYWYQNGYCIWLQIKLIDVQKYNIKWTFRTLSFSTWVKEKYYRIDFNLFGAIHPDTLQHSAKGFYVEIKMKKVLPGRDWCRLLQSKARYNWLKVNPEHFNENSEDSDDPHKRGKKTFLRRMARNQNLFQPRPAGMSDTDSEFSSDVADLEEVDPDDPFTVSAPIESD